MDDLGVFERTQEEPARALWITLGERLSDQQARVDPTGMEVGAMALAQRSQYEHAAGHRGPRTFVLELQLRHVEADGFDACPRRWMTQVSCDALPRMAIAATSPLELEMDRPFLARGPMDRALREPLREVGSPPLRHQTTRTHTKRLEMNAVEWTPWAGFPDLDGLRHVIGRRCVLLLVSEQRRLLGEHHREPRIVLASRAQRLDELEEAHVRLAIGSGFAIRRGERELRSIATRFALRLHERSLAEALGYVCVSGDSRLVGGCDPSARAIAMQRSGMSSQQLGERRGRGMSQHMSKWDRTVAARRRSSKSCEHFVERLALGPREHARFHALGIGLEQRSDASCHRSIDSGARWPESLGRIFP